MVSKGTLIDNDSLNVILLSLFILLRKVAIRLATAATAEVRKMLRNGACLAIIAVLENTTKLNTAALSSGVILVPIYEAFASQGRSKQCGRNG